MSDEERRRLVGLAGWPGTCCVARRLSNRKGHHALDSRSRSIHPLGTRVGHLLHAGWLHPRPLAPGRRDRRHPRDPGPPRAAMKKLVMAALLAAFASAP